ncbi:hypothetical protein V8G54_008304 [Vigna mungo]|uniref:Uncharacterized protein n=1 Tax=Vigna mungo TaxID=3915 RepID=A0AAQ3P5C7_VIGMU
MAENSTTLHALNCDHKHCVPHRYDELCREKKETSKVHRKKLLGKKLKKAMKAFTKRLKMRNGGAKEKEKRRKFQYDPKSYALNFDNGIKECDGVFLDFTARYILGAH